MSTIKTDQPLFADSDQILHIVAKFWDQISAGWRIIWGPHIHHGYYEDNKSQTPLQAQENLIEKLTAILQIKPQDQILDVGCGMGGSSIFLAQKYQVNINGITLSPKQVCIATEQAQAANLSNVTFKVDNALTLTSVADNSIDIVWSLESCEQFYDKNLFIQQAFRVLKPGGQLLLATWCSNQEQYTGKLAAKYKKLCKAFDVPYMPTIQHYSKLLKTNGLTLHYAEDWSKHVQKSWDIGISLVNTYSFFKILKMAGWRGLRFAQQIKMMRNGFKDHTVQYGVFLATK